MFSFKKPPANAKLILTGLSFIFILSYTVNDFLKEREIADPTLSYSPETIFQASNKTESSSGNKRYVSDSSFEVLANTFPKSKTMEPKGSGVPPSPTLQGKALSSSQIRDAQRALASISDSYNLESVFINEYEKEVEARKKKVRNKAKAWRKKRIRSGYPDPFRPKKRKKRKKKKTEKQIMEQTYAEYIDERGKALLKKYRVPDTPAPPKPAVSKKRLTKLADKYLKNRIGSGLAKSILKMKIKYELDDIYQQKDPGAALRKKTKQIRSSLSVAVGEKKLSEIKKKLEQASKPGELNPENNRSSAPRSKIIKNGKWK